MPKHKREFINGEIYHIVLRRIGNELLFGDTDDYYRGIFYIYECNTTKSITIRECRKRRKQFKKLLHQLQMQTDIGQTYVSSDIGQTSAKKFMETIKKIEIDRGLTSVELKEKRIESPIIWKDERDHLVEVLAFCLMPNHIHLLLRQLKKGGISKFIQKIGSGYAGYFRKKYGIKLRGHFFQDRFEAVHIKNDDQLRVVFVYIHTNPTLLIEPEWKQKGVKNPKKVIKFLEEYKWSSYLDYLGKKNFPSVTEREFLLKVMGGPKGCRQWVNSWIKYKGKIRELMEKYSPLSLEK